MADILWALSQLQLADILDICLVGLVFYVLFLLMRGTQAVQMLRGIIVLVIAVLVSSVLPLPAFKWLMRNVLPAMLVAVPVVLQPELRRWLERLGRGAGGLVNRPRRAVTNFVVTEIARACRRLSEQRQGALIVLERTTGLQDYVETGIRLEARVSADLLLTIFYPGTALHDGAVIIREDQIVAAACVLPLSEHLRSDRHVGTRHRAAVGITEQSDAISVVVSEETGVISVAQNGRMARRLDERRLRNILQSNYGGGETPRILRRSSTPNIVEDYPPSEEGTA
ncbi:MAG: TIGR00159 family protein [Chloroflexi bacterium]|nr:TIGR00159 family protein [Chloroflexota bacterium]